MNQPGSPAPAVHFLRTTDSAINHAVELHASDIHITPTASSYRVQLRIHGALSHAIEVQHETGRSLIQAFKAEGKMNIAETRRPQDARLCKKNIELRLATHPTLHGENLVIRLLNTSEKKHLDDLGLCTLAQHHMEQLLQHENGLTLVAGATGSGKTTTLHAMLNTLGKQAGRIATLEDPVEIVNSNAMQTDLSRLPHLNFASGLRSLMRQDPDTILVGEIRDEETAELTLNAALTGHRVFASIHAPDCLGALCRLTELNVRLGSLLNCLNGIVTLRLKAAPNCESRQLFAEVMNLKNMERQLVLNCTGTEQLMRLCTALSYVPFP
ncbi:MAG: Flp pilus assembly complex ATPase component TadA [Gammaproteobacteria bacterium]|uniref:GspE/PulE family protein n=1 Tax=Limnobacter sp. TaxID=2003368 RepID=UPI001DF267A2|nr:ATPase, T2SS/T4P/T4SS family [Limnobacter sp.]MBU0783629.1 Flp pilus assembly complex ATPase component TadA [Gammaproteobacteria bacterium]MBU0850362.1 Flp pilus assembly complex ATPase component TadA [Gammaproteobacteria bacterium]MBU1267471.1 Flp pilus assembly complex ATPase component TadA [Gammaproteobacteria bacterium]MBU1529075.1 Flp pilus assembly complex ATPase component TadA [Gammaproteobacteria bacterium]MBU1781699.1 Flp pilus assembly complex ATPase component TadA [Gammaproteobac